MKSILFTFFNICYLARAFTMHKTAVMPSSSSLGMAPRFDTETQRWYPTGPEDEPEAGYSLVGSLIRAGPKPFLQRITDADGYEQGVLKYMATQKVDRKEAQGNMDAYIENPNDWAYQKLQEQKGAAKKDYANANTSPKQLTLTAVWSAIVVAFFYDLINGVATGKYPAPIDPITIWNRINGNA